MILQPLGKFSHGGYMKNPIGFSHGGFKNPKNSSLTPWKNEPLFFGSFFFTPKGATFHGNVQQNPAN